MPGAVLFWFGLVWFVRSLMIASGRETRGIIRKVAFFFISMSCFARFFSPLGWLCFALLFTFCTVGGLVLRLAFLPLFFY